MRQLSHDEQLQLAQSVMEMLDDWGVSASGKLVLLALPDKVRVRALARYYGELPLPEDAAVHERVDHLIGIAEALRTSYPRNAFMARHWLNQVNARFGLRAPLAAMLEDGLAGIIAVRVHVDCAWDWAQDDARTSTQPH